VWGGRFTNVKDPGHFEWHPGIRIEDVCPDPRSCAVVDFVVVRDSKGADVRNGIIVAMVGLLVATYLYRKNT